MSSQNKLISLKFEQFPRNLPIAVLPKRDRQFEKAENISNEVAAIKRYCKKIKGSCFIIDNSDSFSYNNNW
ncbi:hypothetical protein UACE39S_01665 [Ureibacillus acetophenoni]